MTAATIAATIAAAAAYLPAGRLTSDRAQQLLFDQGGVRLPERFIERLTGIHTRTRMADHEQASTLAATAAARLLDEHRIDPASIDLLVFASASRDMVEPATAHAVQDLLSTNAHCFDLTDACNSLLHGIDAAAALVSVGRARRALVVTGEASSRAVRWDLTSRDEIADHFAGFTFGDAGSALLLTSPNDPANTGSSDGGIVYIASETYSEHWRIGGLFGGGSRHPRDPQWTYFRGDGRHLVGAFENLGSGLLAKTLDATGTSIDNYTAVCVHQVTVPYRDRFLARTGIPERLINPTVERYGNLAAATIGVQLAELHPRLQPGDKILLLGLAGGISLTAMVWQR